MPPLTIAGIFGAAAGLAALTLLLLRFSASDAPEIEVIGLEQAPHQDTAAKESPAMCPWRSPERDLRAFFPAATGYRSETLILSPLRMEIMGRLGPGVPLESNSLYVYRVVGKAADKTSPQGTFLVRRTSGEYGAIEVVVAVGEDRRIVGIGLQRHRELPAISAVMASRAWRSAFSGKSSTAAFRMGDDLPVVPVVARRSCAAVASAVRSLVIEFDVAEKHRLHDRRTAK
jgi:hypothetical protein